MNSNLDKVILITGSSKGISSATAKLLAKHGAKVIINYANSEKNAHKTLETIEKDGGKAIAVKADVSDPEDVKRLFTKSLDAFGRIDVLINCAAVMKNKAFKEVSQADYSAQFNVNVQGVFLTMKAAFDQLSNNGIILNFSSSTTKMMLPNYAIYSATKAAVEQMTRVVSQEIGRGISVNCIAPGPTETNLFLEGKSESFIEELKSKSPFNRIAQPTDIAKVVLFLVSDNSKWISGQVINANGGIV